MNATKRSCFNIDDTEGELIIDVEQLKIAQKIVELAHEIPVKIR